MTQLGVGKEIVTHCSKCKLDLAHIIVVMRDQISPLRVQCKTCNSTHSFKEKKEAAPKRRVSAAKGATKPRLSSEEKSLNLWETAMKKNNSAHLEYSIRTKYTQGQIIDHPSFGPGVVDKAIDTNKIEVIFRTSTKVLIHAK